MVRATQRRTIGDSLIPVPLPPPPSRGLQPFSRRDLQPPRNWPPSKANCERQLLPSRHRDRAPGRHAQALGEFSRAGDIDPDQSGRGMGALLCCCRGEEKPGRSHGEHAFQGTSISKGDGSDIHRSAATGPVCRMIRAPQRRLAGVDGQDGAGSCLGDRAIDGDGTSRRGQTC